jgi:hypothetical protein
MTDDIFYTCERCGEDYELRYGNEPTPYCDPCAHAVVCELRQQLAEAKEMLSTACSYLTETHKDFHWGWSEPHHCYGYFRLGGWVGTEIIDVLRSAVRAENDCG